MTDLNKLKIALKIYDFNNENKEISFSNLIEEFNTEINEKDISMSIDYLFDTGIITAKWEKIEENWQRSFMINPESKNLIKKIDEKRRRI